MPWPKSEASVPLTPPEEMIETPAGLRTVTLICIGATIFTLLSRAMSTGAMSDPARIAAQIVTGIGFLGAGAILRH